MSIQVASFRNACEISELCALGFAEEGIWRRAGRSRHPMEKGCLSLSSGMSCW